MLSPPNFSRNASASTTATIASPISAAAGTAQESARSRKALGGDEADLHDRESPAHRGDRLHRRRDYNRLTIGHAAFEPTEPVARARQTRSVPGLIFQYYLVLDVARAVF